MLVVPAVAPIPENASQSTNFSKLIFLVFLMMRGTADSGCGTVLEVILLVLVIISVGRARA